MKKLTKEEVEQKTELIFIESESGFHFAIDATYLDQVGDMEIQLPTGEVFNSKKLHMSDDKLNVKTNQ